MFDNDHTTLRIIYVLMAALAGAVTALAFLSWKEMSKTEIALTLFVGASFAIFVTPWIAHLAFGMNEADVRTIAGLTYITASGSNTLLPMLIKRMHRLIGGEDEKKK